MHQQRQNSSFQDSAALLQDSEGSSALWRVSQGPGAAGVDGAPGHSSPGL